jgi:hypothetical protein
MRERLEALDRELQARRGALSLGPGRPRATSLASLVARSTGADAEPAFVRAVSVGVARIAHAMLQAFPDNLFWDFDFLTASLVRHARAAQQQVADLEGQVDAIVELQEQFGHETAISFRYVHDFLYGFDWARWVAKAPPQRASVGPFDPRFIAVMHRRGVELLETIDRGGDAKYPPLAGERHRNPFGFSRAPRAEIVLHRHLARRGLIPVEAWRPNARPQWSRDFTELRRREAQALGLNGAEDRDGQV